MKEIEVKIIEINKKRIISKLKKLGAKKNFEGVIRGEFFDYPNKKLDKNKELLRLRTMGKQAFLTFKGKANTKSKVKCCEEIEVQVSEFKKMKEILFAIGLIVRKDTMTKYRISYSIGKTHFEIETPLEEYSFIPSFMEIESTSAKNIYKYAKMLGFEKKDCLNWTGGDIIRFYKKK